MPIEHFRSKAAEMRNLAYRHIHGIPYTAEEACVGTGKDEVCHKVKHSTSKRRMKIDRKQRLKERKLGKGRKRGKRKRG